MRVRWVGGAVTFTKVLGVAKGDHSEVFRCFNNLFANQVAEGISSSQNEPDGHFKEPLIHNHRVVAEASTMTKALIEKMCGFHVNSKQKAVLESTKGQGHLDLDIDIEPYQDETEYVCSVEESTLNWTSTKITESALKHE